MASKPVGNGNFRFSVRSRTVLSHVHVSRKSTLDKTPRLSLVHKYTPRGNNAQGQGAERGLLGLLTFLSDGSDEALLGPSHCGPATASLLLAPNSLPTGTFEGAVDARGVPQDGDVRAGGQRAPQTLAESGCGPKLGAEAVGGGLPLVGARPDPRTALAPVGRRGRDADRRGWGRDGNCRESVHHGGPAGVRDVGLGGLQLAVLELRLR